MASNETVLVEYAISKLYYVQCISIGTSTFWNEHFQLVQFHLQPSTYARRVEEGTGKKHKPGFSWHICLHFLAGS